LTMTFGNTRALPDCDFTWCIVDAPSALNPGPVDVVITAFGTSSGLSPADVFTYTAKPKLVRFETPSTYAGISAVAGLDGNAPAGGATVALVSSNQTLVSSPPSLSISAGQVASAVSLTMNPSPTNQTVTLTATYDGTSLASTVNVLASPPLVLSIGATALDAGQSTIVTLGINSPAPAGGAAVTMSSSNPAAIAVPATATIPAGTYSTTFSVTNQYTSGSNLVTISAIYDGASASDSVDVFIPPPRCPTQQCPRLFYWNSDHCRCERAIIRPHP